jgi:hypothetical protein
VAVLKALQPRPLPPPPLLPAVGGSRPPGGAGVGEGEGTPLAKRLKGWGARLGEWLGLG